MAVRMIPQAGMPAMQTGMMPMGGQIAPMGDSGHTVIGVIHPPADLKKRNTEIIETTANFVATNGPQFQAMIVAREMGNPKFSFVQPGDMYNAYYEMRKRQIAEEATIRALNQGNQPTGEEEKQKEQETVEKPTDVMPVITQPPPDVFSLRMPGAMTTLDLYVHGAVYQLEYREVIKLTAQYVAVNGVSFLSGLSSRESKNQQFDFLKPSHSQFPLFRGLVDACHKVMEPSEEMMLQLKQESEIPSIILERIRHKEAWRRQEDTRVAREKARNSMEGKMNMTVDWHDFVIVETIVLEDEPATPTAPKGEMEMEMGEMTQIPAPPPPQPPPPRPEVVRRRVMVDSEVDKFQICPRCQRKIPISEFAEHMRIELLDPKWKEQREEKEQEGKHQEAMLARQADMSKYLAGLARTRTDIFGQEDISVRDAVAQEHQGRSVYVPPPKNPPPPPHHPSKRVKR